VYCIRLFVFLVFCFTTAPVFAGLFSDNEARQLIQQLQARASAAEDALSKMDAAHKQQTSALLDLQTLIETQNADMRKLRGQIEELVHNLQDAEKRQKDFYVDLDGRLRRFESADSASVEKNNSVKNKADDSVNENRALEAALGFYKAEKFQDAIIAFQGFLGAYPKSVHTANVRYWAGNAYYMLKDYKSSLENFQVIANKFDTYPKIAEVLFSIADCQELLNDNEAAKLTLKQISTKYPNSEAAAKAKKELASFK
jgi:tol-pal system protein YbgF